MKVAMIGTGYVGLVSGVCFSEFGVEVTCVDNLAEKIARLERGEIPIYEPGLEALVRRNAEAGRLRFTTDLAAAVDAADVIFICVGTPMGVDRRADMRYVFGAGAEIARALKKPGKVIVTKSTVPVGTAQKLKQIISENLPAPIEFHVASNPEFLREGSAVEDFLRPNRVVIGAESDYAANQVKALYRPLYLIETPIVITNLETSELIKYAANGFLAVKISFINEVAALCERVGADVKIVAKGMGLDQRIGSKFLHPGPGYGGSCFPKDTEALLMTAEDAGGDFRLIRAAIDANEGIPARLVARMDQALGGLQGKTIAQLGLAFKPETDDLRDSPALKLLDRLLAAGATVRACDPIAMRGAQALYPQLALSKDPYEAVQGADAVMLVTEWNLFRQLDLTRVRSLLKGPHFFDWRNVYEPEMMARAGFTYHSVGRREA